jgi:hypothetical protein
MKLIHCLAVLGLLMSFALRVPAADPGPIHFQFSVVQQVSEGPVITKTNVAAKATNIVSSAKYVTSNYVLDNARLLKMLANSYSTNFPATADLKMFGNFGIAVVDGTNILLAPTIMNLTYSNLWTISGSQTDGRFSSQKGSVTRSSIDFIQIYPATFTYDDSGLTTKDGSITSLSIPGLESVKTLSTRVENDYKNYNFDIKFTGAGFGTIFNNTSSNRFVLSGNLSALINGPP